MQYKMTPTEYFRKLTELYFESREAKYYNPNIKRGRSASVSSSFEDLTALFIALNNPHPCNYYVDQPLRFTGNATRYPDIVIQDMDGEIRNLIDVKSDIGWNRDGMYRFCKEWESRIQTVQGTSTQFKGGTTKEMKSGHFSDRLKYHILIASTENSGPQVLEDHAKVRAQMKHVQLYILSDGIHPNNYKYNQTETLNHIHIHEDEFERLFDHIIDPTKL